MSLTVCHDIECHKKPPPGPCLIRGMNCKPHSGRLRETLDILFLESYLIEMANQIFQHDLVIRESHLDFFGHVNNAVYLQLFEEARWEFITANGYGMHKIRKIQQGPVMLEVQLKFLREMTVRQKISIFSQVLEQNKKIGTLAQWIEDEAKNKLAEARFVMGFFDMTTRRLMTPPEPWLRAIGIEKK
jgi:thioesterase-3